jgi:hypothetical protein
MANSRDEHGADAPVGRRRAWLSEARRAPPDRWTASPSRLPRCRGVSRSFPVSGANGLPNAWVEYGCRLRRNFNNEVKLCRMRSAAPNEVLLGNDVSSKALLGTQQELSVVGPSDDEGAHGEMLR